MNQTHPMRPDTAASGSKPMSPRAKKWLIIGALLLACTGYASWSNNQPVSQGEEVGTIECIDRGGEIQGNTCVLPPAEFQP